MLVAQKGILLNLVLILSLVSYALAEEGVEGPAIVDQPVVSQTELNQPSDFQTGAPESETVPNTEAQIFPETTSQANSETIAPTTQLQTITTTPETNSETSVVTTEVQTTTPETTVTSESSTVQETTTTTPNVVDEDTILTRKVDELEAAPAKEDAGASIVVDSEAIQNDQTTTVAIEEAKVSVIAQKAINYLVVAADIQSDQTTNAAAVESTTAIDVPETQQTEKIETTTEPVRKTTTGRNSSNNTLLAKVAASAIRVSRKRIGNTSAESTNGLALVWIMAFLSATKLILQ